VSDPTQTLSVELTPKAARALLAADPFPKANTEDWIEARDALLSALAKAENDPEVLHA
jgi:hypothetical protein